MAKRLIKKVVDSGQDPHLAILDYRNTPTQGTDFSPAQRSLGRRTRTLLPTSSNLLKPKEINTEHVKQNKKYSNLRSAMYYNIGSKDLDPLNEGDVVRIKPTVMGKKSWEKGTIVERLDERSYNVLSDSGVLRRNRVHLKRTKESNNDSNKDHTTVSQYDGNVYNKPSNVGDTVVMSNEYSGTQDDTVSRNEEPCTETQESRSVRSTRCKLPAKFNDYVVTRK